MSNKKVRVRVTKKKLNKKRFIIFILSLIIIISLVIDIVKLPIKNIYVIGNNIVSDKEIIESAKLDNYPSFLKTYFNNIEKKLLGNKIIKNVQVRRDIFRKIYIEVEEYRPLFIYQNKIILSSGDKIDNNININYLPYVTNDIESIYQKFIVKLDKVDEEILFKISEIQYQPNEVDKERFLFSMSDANDVYITLSKIDKINKYNSIVQKLDNKKGIIYLDSGDYVEIKDVNNLGKCLKKT